MSNEVVIHPTGGSAMLLDKNVFDQAYRAAKLFAASKLVPTHFQGKEPDCFIGLLIAHRMKEDALTVMQNMYLVGNRPGWLTQYMIARANTSGAFKGRITWDTEGAGDGMKVTAKATLADNGEKVSVAVDMKMAKAEGWTKNSKYQSMPEHMLRWRSAAMLIRLYAPEVMLGYQTAEELETMPPMKDITPKEDSVIANINAAIEVERTPAQEVVDADTGEITDAEPVETAANPDHAPAMENLYAQLAPDDMPDGSGAELEKKGKELLRRILADGDKIGLIEDFGGDEFLKKLGAAGKGMLLGKIRGV